MQCSECPVLKVPEIYRVLYDYSLNKELFSICGKVNRVFPKNIICIGPKLCEDVNWKNIEKWAKENPEKAKRIYVGWKTANKRNA